MARRWALRRTAGARPASATCPTRCGPTGVPPFGNRKGEPQFRAPARAERNGPLTELSCAGLDRAPLQRAAQGGVKGELAPGSPVEPSSPPLDAQFGESGQRFGSIRPVTLGVFGVSRVQCNQVVGLVRIPPLLDAPLRVIRWQFSRSLSQMASAAPASPMTLPHFSMGT